MNNREGDIYLIVGLYDKFLNDIYGIEDAITITDYSNDSIKYHTWTINPICVQNRVITNIRISDVLVREMLNALQTMSIDDVLMLNKEIISNSLE